MRIRGAFLFSFAAFALAPACLAQGGTGCGYSFTPSGTITAVAKNAAVATLNVRTNCSWTASTTATWITLLSTGPFLGNAAINFSVADNTGTAFRRGTILINDQAITVQQTGIACAYAVTAPSANVPADAGTLQFAINTDPACSWTAASASSWVALDNVGASGPGIVTAAFSANASPQARTASLLIAGKQMSVGQAGAGIKFSADSIQNAASLSGGALSPGEIFVIYGSGLGPQTLTTLRTTTDGKSITTTLGGTRVLFDGVPAPILYSSATQVSAIVPYALQGPISHLTVENTGVPSAPVSVQVLPATPGIFTISQTGTGQGAVRNQDFSVNGPYNPATAGQSLIIYWTGGGPLSMPFVDGQLVTTNPPFPMVTYPMTVTLGDVEAQITYAGAVPTLVPGILQTNIVIPDNAPKGNAVPIAISLGGIFSTPAGVTVSIQ